MGFNVGEAHSTAHKISDYFFGAYRSPPSDSYATWDPPGPEWPQGPKGPERSLVKQNAIEVSIVSMVDVVALAMPTREGTE
tara:strand:- start:957 stop:1199 length:243 start_codon:yes stop_codon:yes gene_type:complete